MRQCLCTVKFKTSFGNGKLNANFRATMVTIFHFVFSVFPFGFILWTKFSSTWGAGLRSSLLAFTSCLRLLHYLTLSLCLSYLAHLVLYFCRTQQTFLTWQVHFWPSINNLFLIFTFYSFYFIFLIFLPILQRKTLTLAFVPIWQSFSKIYLLYVYVLQGQGLG